MGSAGDACLVGGFGGGFREIGVHRHGMLHFYFWAASDAEERTAIQPLHVYFSFVVDLSAVGFPGLGLGLGAGGICLGAH